MALSLDLLLELGDVVALVGVAQFLLNGLHLLIQVVLALRLLHLALDAAADLLLDLQHRDLALHQRIDTLEPLGDDRALEHFLLVGDLDRQMRGDGVSELRVVLDLADRAQYLGRDLLVELDVVLELRHGRAGKRLDLVLGADRLGYALDLRFEVVWIVCVRRDVGARRPLDQNFHGPVRQLQKLQHGGERAHLVDRIRRRIVVARILLGSEQDLLVGAHHLFERVDGLLAADEQRHDHVREDYDIAQRQDRIKLFCRRCLVFGCFELAHLLFPLRPRTPSRYSAAAPIIRRRRTRNAFLTKVAASNSAQAAGLRPALMIEEIGVAQLLFKSAPDEADEGPHHITQALEPFSSTRSE